MWRCRKKKKKEKEKEEGEKTLKAFGITPTAFPVRLNFEPEDRVFTAPVLSSEYHCRTLFSGPVCTTILLIPTTKTTVKKKKKRGVNWENKHQGQSSRGRPGVDGNSCQSFQRSTWRGDSGSNSFSPSVLWKYECQLIFSRGPSAHF